MKKITVMFLFVAAAMVAIGCGGPQGYKRVGGKAMPADGSWDGVFHSQAYGRMELTANGSTVYGLYEHERWYGKIEGEADGDVLNFRWTQWNMDMSGKTRESRGQGYFRYVIETEGTPEKPRYAHFVRGEWGYDQDNAGNKWEAVKFPAGTKKVLTAEGQGGGEEEKTHDPFGGGGGGSSSSSSSDSGGGGGLGGGGGGLGGDSGGGGMDDVDDLF